LGNPIQHNKRDETTITDLLFVMDQASHLDDTLHVIYPQLGQYIRFRHFEAAWSLISFHFASSHGAVQANKSLRPAFAGQKSFFQPCCPRVAPIGGISSLKEITRMVSAKFQYRPKAGEAHFQNSWDRLSICFSLT
jgi:hypothetical protein